MVSTPVTVVSGLAAAARHGILVKGGDVYLENGRRLKAMALDKTGTLTRGAAALTDALAPPVPLADVPGERALLLAASLDEHSTHPVARALSTAGARGGRTRRSCPSTISGCSTGAACRA